MNFLAEFWPEILLSLATAGALGACRYFIGQMKKYKTLLEKQDNNELDHRIETKTEPIVEEIEQLRDYIRNMETEDKKKMDLILSSYKFRLTQLCKQYLHRGQMTTAEYEQLNEFYTVYSGLGGNGQAKDYYEKAVKVDIVD